MSEIKLAPHACGKGVPKINIPNEVTILNVYCSIIIDKLYLLYDYYSSLDTLSSITKDFILRKLSRGITDFTSIYLLYGETNEAREYLSAISNIRFIWISNFTELAVKEEEVEGHILLQNDETFKAIQFYFAEVNLVVDTLYEDFYIKNDSEWYDTVQFGTLLYAAGVKEVNIIETSDIDKLN